MLNIENILNKALEIEESGFYPLLKLTNSKSTHSPFIEGELYGFSELKDYYKEELLKIKEKGIIINLTKGNSIIQDNSLDFLKTIDEKNLLNKNNNKRLFLFSPERVQYSLERIKHYTATSPKDFQNYVFFTNYEMHIESIREKFSTSDYKLIESSRPCQMNTIHVKPIDSNGIGFTIINIGVGPNNAKNITDHLAVLRSKLWLMIGHCGGLRNHQELGDFVIADKFITDCGIINKIQRSKLPLPIIPTFPINIALNEILSGSNLSYRLGTVFTTEDRNWELSYSEYKDYFDEDRSIAIDMESSIISAQGFKYKIPNATLLMVSDKPLHGKLKKSKEAVDFYENSKKLHIEIAIKLIKKINENQDKYLNHNYLGAMLGAKDDSLFY